MSRGKSKRGPTPRRKPWQPLQRAGLDPAKYEAAGLSAPDAAYVNDLYSVFVREIGHGALHLSFHRHDRAAIRDWRHFQAIKNEVAGAERTAIEVFPPESQLVDAANEYHLWVLPEDYPLPFVMDARNVMDADEGRRQMAEFGIVGPTKARQREWQPGLPTGKGMEAVA